MSQARAKRLRSFAAVAALALLASGCASISQNRGVDAVSALAKERLGKDARLLRTDDDARSLARLIDEKLRTPLQADDAVQIALLNNRALQSTYWNVGIAEADLVQAGRLQNPSFSFQRTLQGNEVDIERSLTLNLVRMLTAPLAQRIEARRFEQTRLMVANQMLLHAAETRRAYFDAVAAAQGVSYSMQVSRAAQASAELTGRMVQAGNSSQLDLAREQAFDAEATAAVGRAGKRALAAREKLTRLMGLWGSNAQYRLPDRLPDLPAAPAELDDIERIAIRDRLDIQAAKVEAAQTASSLGLTRATRFVNVLDLGYVRNSSAGQPSAPGYVITLELPLFDWGSARVAKSEAIYMQAVNKVAQTATEARSEARESYLDYRTSYDLAKHYRDQVIPLRKKISDETLLRYNGMLISVFELLADSREQASAVNSYIDALKDYWIAQTNLEAALGGRLPAQTAESSKGHTK
jgi:outer membrane protein TolC